MPLTKADLFDRVQDAIQASGYRSIVLDESHPFRLRLFPSGDGDQSRDVKIYIWNCTHGGGSHRPADEYRVQVTGTSLTETPGYTPLVLGWREQVGVFAAFDFFKHLHHSSQSPSMQIRVQTMRDAVARGIAAQAKNNEVVVAVRPDCFAPYAFFRDAMHGLAEHDEGSVAGTEDFVRKLSNAGALSDTDIQRVTDTPRREVLVTIRRWHRTADFRNRVLTAYRNQCAMCGTQLRLVEAAHILPVQVPGSSDRTSNGVALCSLHHTAFDAALISFDEQYRTEISPELVADLVEKRLDTGLADFQGALLPGLLLPSSRTEWPDQNFITLGREIRGWT